MELSRNSATVIGGKYKGKMAVLFGETEKRFDVEIPGVGRRFLKKENVSFGKGGQGSPPEKTGYCVSPECNDQRIVDEICVLKSEVSALRRELRNAQEDFRLASNSVQKLIRVLGLLEIV